MAILFPVHLGFAGFLPDEAQVEYPACAAKYLAFLSLDQAPSEIPLLDAVGRIGNATRRPPVPLASELIDPRGVKRHRPWKNILMRKILLAFAATAIIATPLATVSNAEETIVIKKEHSDGTESKTVIKKEHELDVLPIPHVEEKTTVIKKERD